MEALGFLDDDTGEIKNTPTVVTLEPFEAGNLKTPSSVPKSPILHVLPVPLHWSFDVIYDKFSEFGKIREIRSTLGHQFKYFEIWVIFDEPVDAQRACEEFNPGISTLRYSIVSNYPRGSDAYIPPCFDEDLKHDDKVIRHPNPPRWLIISTHNERGNLFKIKKFINQKLGNVKRPEISRFGRSSFLVHCKSDGQAAMLLNMKLDKEGLVKEIKPHYDFSYARGVIFNEDVYELSEN